MTSSPKQRLAVIATEEITKKQIDQTLAEGKTHVKFKSNKVQRRLLKEQERIRRLREVRENKFKAAQKAAAKARQTAQGGGIGLAHPVADRGTFGGTMKVIEESAYFIDKDGKRVPVPSDEAKEIAKAFEPAEEEDLTGAPGPEYTYQPHNGEEEGKVFLNLYGDENHYKPFPEVGEMVRADGLVSALRTLGEGVMLTEEEKAKLVDIDYVFDKLVYADQGPYSPDSVVYEPAVDVKVVDNPTGINENGLVMSPSVLADFPINPFEPESPGSRAQMFGSHLSSALKAEEAQQRDTDTSGMGLLPHQETFADSVLAEHSLPPFTVNDGDGKTQLFQPGLTDMITQDGKDNIEAMSQALYDTGLVSVNDDQKT